MNFADCETYDPNAIFRFLPTDEAAGRAFLAWAELQLRETTLKRDQVAFKVSALRLTIEGVNRLRIIEASEQNPNRPADSPTPAS